MTSKELPDDAGAGNGGGGRAAPPPPDSRAHLTDRRFGLLVALAAVLLLALRLAAVSREGINWDEFFYFARAADTLQTGTLQSGGRPGLGAVVALPIVRDCSDEISVVRRARVVWTAIVALSAVALWRLIRRLLDDDRAARTAATAAVALWCLVPLFLRWSLQVRNDQPAILFSLWAGCALLASKSRPGLALVGGLLGGAGYLFSQKALYSLALVGLLALGDRFLRRQWQPKRDALRAALFGAGGCLVVGAFHAIVPRFFERPPAFTITQAAAQLDFYRLRVGFAVYRGMLPTLLPHLALGALLLALTALALARPSVERRLLGIAWAVLGLGTAVAVFHTGRFAYFWVTLGLFPAVGLALALPAISRRWSAPLLGRIALAAAFGALLVQGLVFSVGLLQDSQRVQRESLWFLQRNFPAGQDGFHLDRAPFCRHETDPLPVYLSDHILREFSGPARGANIERFLKRFRERGVYFLLHSYRLPAFPREIQLFWRDHFVPYYQSVWVPGFRLDPASGAVGRFEVLVAGSYRLEPTAPVAGGSVRIGGSTVAMDESIVLAPGWHEADLSGLSAPAGLVWDLKEPPAEPGQPFYSEAMISEIKFGTLRR